jgi:hypothetical protein
MKAVVLALALVACGGSSKNDPPPDPSTAIAVGAKLPSVQLTRPSGQAVALADAIGSHDKAVIVFYRGYF